MNEDDCVEVGNIIVCYGDSGLARFHVINVEIEGSTEFPYYVRRIKAVELDNPSAAPYEEWMDTVAVMMIEIVDKEE